jgi:hypothetical protein
MNSAAVTCEAEHKRNTKEKQIPLGLPEEITAEMDTVPRA